MSVVLVRIFHLLLFLLLLRLFLDGRSSLLLAVFVLGDVSCGSNGSRDRSRSVEGLRRSHYDPASVSRASKGRFNHSQ
jgi:hypothetical protein